MKYILIALFALLAISCKPSYSYEGQQRGGDPYRIEWITTKGLVATCFVVDHSAGRMTTSVDGGVETSAYRFVPDRGSLNVYDAKGALVEALPIRDYIFYCSSKGYTKIPRSNDISDLISDDYRDMSAKLIDHLRVTKAIP